MSRQKKAVARDPFDGIGPSQELQDLRIIGPEDAAFVADAERQFRVDYPPLELAKLTMSYVVCEAARVLGPPAKQMLRSDGTMFPSVRKALGAVTNELTEAIEKNIKEGRDPYPLLARKAVCYAGVRMRARVRCAAGATPLIFGSIEATIRQFFAIGASEHDVDVLFWWGEEAVIRVSAYAYCRSLDLHNQQRKSLEYLVGLSDSPDPFLCDRMRFYAQKEEYDRLERMRGEQYLNLPYQYKPEHDSAMKYRKLRISGDNPEDRRILYPLISVLMEARYRKAQPRNQRGYIRNAVFNQCRDRVKADESEHIKAKKQKISLTSLQDEVTPRRSQADEQTERTVAQIIESGQQEILDIFGHQAEPIISMDDALAEVACLKPEDRDLIAFIVGYFEPGMTLQKLPAYLTEVTGTTWDERRVDNARKKWSAIHPRLRENLIGNLRAPVSGSHTIYRERLRDGHWIWQHVPLRQVDEN